MLYTNGCGVDQDLQEAFKWFHRAAQNGHDKAAVNVGLSFLNGKGAMADAVEAFRWFEAARLKLALARSATQYGRALRTRPGSASSDSFRAMNILRMAADQGYEIWSSGQSWSDAAKGKGVAQDYAKAAELYKRAVEAGNLTAMSNLATLYQIERP